MRHSHAPSLSVRVAILVAGAAGGVGVLALAAWLVGPTLTWIRAPIADAPSMMPNTALMIVATAAAVIARARPGGARRQVGRGLAVLVIALAGATLVEHLTGAALHLDGLLVAGAPAPAANTSVAFLALGVAVLGLDAARAPVVFELGAVAATSLGLMVAIGYLFDYAYLTRPSENGGGMALNTAVALIALGVATLCARPARGLMAILSSPYVGGAMARRLLLVGLVATPVAGALAVAMQHAGLYPAPGAAVLDTVLNMLVLFGALLVLGRLLNRADARRGEVEAELRQWKRFFDQAEFGAVFGSPDRKLLRVNAAFARMHGYGADELIGRPLTDLFAPEAWELARDHLDTVEALGTHRFEAVSVRKDGSRLPIIVDATAVRDPAGRLLYRVAYVQDISAERAARDAQARLAALVESAEDAIVAKRLDGIVLDWNHGAERIYGWTRDEMIGRSIVAIVPPDRRAEREDVLARIARGDVVGQLDTERVRKDGVRIPVSLTYSRILDDRGELIGISTIERDMSAQRAAADALADAHRRLEAVMAAHLAVSDAIARLPSTGIRPVLEVIAQQAKLLTGADYASVDVAPPEQGVAAPVAEIGERPARLARGTAPGLVADERARLGPVCEDDDVIDVPVLYQGEVKGNLILMGKQPRFGAGDRAAAELLARYLGSAIEAAILYERERVQRSRFEAVITQMPDGVIVLDQHGGLVLENEASRSLPVDREYVGEHRRRQARNVCLPSGERLAPERLPGVRAVRGESVIDEEYALELADGRLQPIAVSAKPVQIGDRIAGAVVVTRDLRTHKELERLREEWSSVIAHELRQPVNSIRLAAELIGRGPLEARPRAWVQRIGADALRLNAMIQDLLDSSRLEARRLSLRVEAVSLVDLISTALERAPGLGARAEVTIASGAARVQADAGRLLQVITNLLSNAEKYGAPDTPVVIRADRDGAMVRVAVLNHGAGIAAEDLPRLFDRFARTRAAQESKVDGIGLGLYLSKGLIEAQGGRMWVESTPGETTTFQFTIPVAAERAADAAAAPAE